MRKGDRLVLKTKQSLIVPYQTRMPSAGYFSNDDDYRVPTATTIRTEVYEPYNVYEVEDYDDNGLVKIKGMEAYVSEEHFESFKKYEFNRALKKL